MGLVAFGRPVKKLVGATITKLATLQPIRRMTRPRPLKALISQKKIFTVDLTNKGIRMGIANYIMFDSADLDNRQWHTAIFANASRSSTPLTSIEELEEHVLPSPVKSQVATELFPDFTPLKQPAPSKGEQSPTKKYNSRRNL
ncbi:hypothetical protein POUND7_009986 [Theobroma cacao]